MIQKFTKFKIENTTQILGGDDMYRETNINRAKSADKLHNKITQLMMS